MAQPATTGLDCGALGAPPVYRHVIVVVMENSSYREIAGAARAPYINAVAAACGIANDYHRVTHESLPNYLALTDGAPLAGLQPFAHDCAPSLLKTIEDLLGLPELGQAGAASDMQTAFNL